MSSKTKVKSARSNRPQATKRAEERIRKLIENSMLQLQTYPRQAQKNMQQAEELAGQFEFIEYMPKIMLIDGTARWQLGLHDEATKVLSNCIRTARKRMLWKVMAQAELNLGNSYHFRGKLQKAFTHYQRSLKLQVTHGPFKGTSGIISNVASLYLAVGKPKRAIRYFTKAIAFAKKENNPQAIAFALHNLAEAYSSLGKIDHSYRLYEQSLHHSSKHGIQLLQMVTQTNLAGIDIMMGKFSTAETSLHASMKFFQRTDHTTGLCSAYLAMAKLRYQQKNLDDAAHYLDLVIAQASKMNMLEELERCYEMYYQIHELRSDVVKSTRFKKLLETIRKVRRKRNSRFDGKDTKLRLLVASLEAMSEHHEAKIQELRMISEKLALMKRITGEKILSALGEVNEQCGAMAKLTKPLEDCADSIRRLEEKTRPVDQILCVLSRYAEVSATQLFPDAVDLNRVLQTVMHLKKDPLTECKASIKHDLLPVIQGHEDQIKLLFEMLLDLLMQSGNRSSPALSVASRSKENGYVLEFSYHTALLTTTDFPQTNDFKITNENLTAFSSVSIQLSLGSKIAEANSGRFWYGTDVNNGLKIYLHLLSN